MTNSSSFICDPNHGITIKGCPSVPNDKAPKILYHYTNLQTLALILKNRTLRLNSLTHMDDKQECQTSDVGKLGRFFFASCWTDDPTESIPMWKMYASLDSGVRIGLPPNPFIWELLPVGYVANLVGIPDAQEREKFVALLITATDLEKGYFSTQLGAKSLLHRIDYIDDKERLIPKIKRDQSTLEFGEFGLVKHTGWEFQQEWRYLLPLLPPRQEGDQRTITERLPEIFDGMRDGTLAMPIDYYDLRLNPSTLTSIEITRSPAMSAGNRILFDVLVEKYCPDAIVRPSILADTL